MANAKGNIVIFGAGVIGLQTGIRLIEEGFSVIIIAEFVPGDDSIEYTSPKAGAQWRSHCHPDDFEQQSWDRLTYINWKETCFREHATNVTMADRTGLTMYPTKLLYDSKTHQDLLHTGDPSSSGGFWFREFVDSFRTIRPAPEGYAAAVRYNTIFVDVPIYMNYLMTAFRKLGGKIMRHKLPVHSGIRGAIDESIKVIENECAGRTARDCIYINATGIGARALCDDKNVYPVRGQVLLVKGVSKEAVSRIGQDSTTGEDFVAYIIPRPLTGVTIIGGCRQADNWSATEDPQISQQIIERCAPLAPELLTGPGGAFEVLGCQVGLRPARKGGARIERETVVDSHGQTQTVIHAYGNGGGGYQNSFGVADKVSHLLREESGILKSKL